MQSARSRQPSRGAKRTSRAEATPHPGPLPSEGRGKNPGGRETKYRAEYAEQAHKLTLLGYTDAQLADFFNVTEQTVNNWKHQHAGFFESIKRGKAAADCEVSEALFNRAIGFSKKQVKIFSHDGGSFEHEYDEYYPPEVAAGIFWLKNRQPGLWRDKQQLEHTGRDGGAIQHEEMTAEDCLKLARERGLLTNGNH